MFVSLDTSYQNTLFRVGVVSRETESHNFDNREIPSELKNEFLLLLDNKECVFVIEPGPLSVAKKDFAYNPKLTEEAVQWCKDTFAPLPYPEMGTYWEFRKLKVTRLNQLWNKSIGEIC